MTNDPFLVESVSQRIAFWIAVFLTRAPSAALIRFVMTAWFDPMSRRVVHQIGPSVQRKTGIMSNLEELVGRG
jgi:hypothetical protein